MQAATIRTEIQSIDWQKHTVRLHELVQKKPIVVGLSVVGFLLVVNRIGIGGEKESRIVELGTAIDFQKGRILDDRESTCYYGREKLLSQKTRAMFGGQAKLEARLLELEKKLQKAQAKPDYNPPKGQLAASGQGSPLGPNPQGATAYAFEAPKKQ